MIKVYLDSQDFSHFSVEHKDHIKFSSVKSELLDLKKSGRVKFLFSDVHIYESYHKNKESIKEGLGRIKSIAEFCGEGDSLPSITSLLEHEVAAQALIRQNKEVPILSSNWFPDIGIRNNPMDRPERQNRKQRRILAKKLFNSGLADEMVKEFRLKFPFITNGQVFLDYYMHKVEWSAVVDVVEMGFRDINGLCSFLATCEDEAMDVPGILKTGYEGYMQTMKSLMENVDAMRLEASNRGVDLEMDITREIDKSAQILYSSICNALMGGGMLSHEPDCDFKMGEARSLTVLVAYIAKLARRSTQVRMARLPKESDFADALHVSYLPMVHLFRSDKFAADILKEASPDRRDDIVKDIFDLPGQIRSRL